MKIQHRFLWYILWASIFLLSGCSGKEKEAVWGVYNEPIPRTELPESAGVREMSILWQTTVGHAGEDGYALLRPALDSGAIYVANQAGGIRKLDLQSGDTLWQNNLKRPVYAAVGWGEGLVLVGLEDGTLVALSGMDGTLRWEQQTGRQISAVPVAGSARVVVRTADGRIMGFDSVDGSLVWEVQRTVSGLGLHGDSMPLIAGDTVVTGLSNGRILANAVVNGRDYWEADLSFVRGTSELEQLSDIDTPPVLSGTTLYAATYQGDVVALNSQNAAVLWRYPFSTRLPMEVDAGQLLVTGSLGDILVLDAENGEVLWEQRAFRGRGMTNPVTVGSRVIVGDADGVLHLLDRMDGTLLQSLKADRSAITSLVRQGGSVIAVSANGRVLAMAVDEF